MIILIDFDGTCVQHKYPEIGEDIEHCQEVLKRLVECGHNIILNTMRDKKELKAAVQWFSDKNIKLYGINENPSQKSWTTSKKIHGDISIDDINLGIPLKFNKEINRNYVDWYEIERLLEKQNVFNDFVKTLNEYFNTFIEK